MARQRTGKTPGVDCVYHRVSPTPDAPIPVHPAQFEVHCAMLRRSFSVLPLGEYVQKTCRGRSSERLLRQPFDDGFSNSMEHALPVLKRTHILPATHSRLQSEARWPPNWNWRREPPAEGSGARRARNRVLRSPHQAAAAWLWRARAAGHRRGSRRLAGERSAALAPRPRAADECAPDSRVRHQYDLWGLPRTRSQFWAGAPSRAAHEIEEHIREWRK
jgi:hypothetical protein